MFCELAALENAYADNSIEVGVGASKIAPLLLLEELDEDDVPTGGVAPVLTLAALLDSLLPLLPPPPHAAKESKVKISQQGRASFLRLNPFMLPCPSCYLNPILFEILIHNQREHWLINPSWTMASSSANLAVLAIFLRCKKQTPDTLGDDERAH